MIKNAMKLLLITALSTGFQALALSTSEEAKVKEVAREFIKDHLKAPATAIFSKETVCAPIGKADFEEAKGTGPTPDCKPQTAEKVGDGSDAAIYRAAVDSQNSYGALIRTKFQIWVTVSNGKWSMFNPAEKVQLLKNVCEELNAGKRLLKNGALEDCRAQYPNAR